MTKIAPGSHQARDTPRRDLTLIDALRAQRLLNSRARQLVSGPAFVVWNALLDSTLGFQKTEALHFHGFLAQQANVTTKTVSRAVRTLVDAGLIGYEPGYASEATGKNVPSRFVVLDVATALSQGVPPDEGAPPSQAPPVPPHQSPPSPLTRGDRPPSLVPTVPPDESTYRGEKVVGKKVTGENNGEGDLTTAVMAAAPPLLVEAGADGQAVAAEFFEAMRQTGAPIPSGKQRTITNGVAQAMADGYAREAVLVGLGYWVADGHLFAKQITEFVQKARLHGGPVPEQGEVDDLLTEGRDRFARRQAQRVNGGPSKAETRRAASAAAIREFTRSTQ